MSWATQRTSSFPRVGKSGRGFPRPDRQSPADRPAPYPYVCTIQEAQPRPQTAPHPSSCWSPHWAPPAQSRANSASASTPQAAAYPPAPQQPPAAPRQSRPPQNHCATIAQVRTKANAIARSSFPLALPPQQLPLVVERNQHQRQSQQQKRNDPVKFLQERKVEKKNLHDHHAQQHQRLPTDRLRFLPESCAQQPQRPHQPQHRKRQLLRVPAINSQRRHAPEHVPHLQRARRQCQNVCHHSRDHKIHAFRLAQLFITRRREVTTQRHARHANRKRSKPRIQQECIGRNRNQRQAPRHNRKQRQPSPAHRGKSRPQSAPDQHRTLHRPRDRDPIPVQPDRYRQRHERQRQPRVQNPR